MAFCLADARLLVHNVGAAQACAGKLCNGQYAIGCCPCVRVNHLPRLVLNVSIAIANVSETLGIRIQAYQSSQLTEGLIGKQEFEVRGGPA